jgi:alkylation response protein AidB-like acyl-CoA dehydrogenase
MSVSEAIAKHPFSSPELSPAPAFNQTAYRILSEPETISIAHRVANDIALLAQDATENNQVPYRQAELLSQSGLTAIYVPKHLGGLGASIKTVVDVVRIISRADGGVGQLLQIHNVMIRGVFARPDDEFRKRLIADILNGKRFGNALAETGGKNKFAHNTRVEKTADGKYLLNGRKFYSTGSYLAEWISLTATSEFGPVGVLLHRDTPGLTLVDDWHAFGQQHSVSGTVIFENVVVDERFIPKPGGPARTMPRTSLTWPQILHAAIDTGIASGALAAATDYLRNHSRPWVDAEVERAVEEHHIIKRIGEYAVAVRGAEALLRYAADVFDQHLLDPDNTELQDELILAVASARAQSDHASLFVASDMFSLLGASASLNKWNLNRFWADARVHTTHDPIRWRLHHVGNYYLNGVPPDEYGAAIRAKRAELAAVANPTN